MGIESWTLGGGHGEEGLMKLAVGIECDIGWWQGLLKSERTHQGWCEVFGWVLDSNKFESILNELSTITSSVSKWILS